MRKVWILLAFLIIPFLAHAADIPQAVGWVNDFAGVISPGYKAKLNSLIDELEQKTSAEIAVVTIGSIAPYDEREYARLLFDSWKPGKKGKDNGVLVFLAIKERRWRIETGYGVEGVLPDGLCGEIGRNYMVPYFKEGNYGAGLYEGTLKISQVIAKDYNVSLNSLQDFKELPSEKKRAVDSIVLLFSLLFIIGIGILLRYFSYQERKYRNRCGYRGYGRGYGWGGGFGGFGGGGGGGGGFGGGGGGGGGAGGGF